MMNFYLTVSVLTVIFTTAFAGSILEPKQDDASVKIAGEAAQMPFMNPLMYPYFMNGMGMMGMGGYGMGMGMGMNMGDMNMGGMESTIAPPTTAITGATTSQYEEYPVDYSIK